MNRFLLKFSIISEILLKDVPNNISIAIVYNPIYIFFVCCIFFLLVLLVIYIMPITNIIKIIVTGAEIDVFHNEDNLFYRF